MENRSIKFKNPLKNFHFSGDEPNLSKYSKVNQAMQIFSIIEKYGLSVSLPSESLVCNAGTVLNVKEIVDSNMNNTDTIENTCKGNI